MRGEERIKDLRGEDQVPRGGTGVDLSEGERRRESEGRAERAEDLRGEDLRGESVRRGEA